MNEMNITESKEIVINDRALSLEFADGIKISEGNLKSIPTQQNIAAISRMVTPAFSLQDIVGRTIQIKNFEISTSTATIWQQTFTIATLLDYLDINNNIRSFFSYAGITASLIYEVQSVVQHVGVLVSYVFPGDPNYLRATGYLGARGSDVNSLFKFKRLAGMPIPLGISETHIQRLPYVSVYPAHQLVRKQSDTFYDGFDPPLFTISLRPFIPLTIGAQGSATASVNVLIRMDAITTNGYGYAAQ